jgi:adapter protein MecA 1/2
MRIERVSNNQFTMFLTFDDLIERGFTKDDLWYDAKDVRSLFSDMMYEASFELGIELAGSLLVQVYLMQAQGMHVTVTQKIADSDWEDDFIEMKVTLDESSELIFSFSDFEHVIQVSYCLSNLKISGGAIYYMNERYYMLLDKLDLKHNKVEDVIAVMSEYSMPSIITSHRILEYGKMVIDKDAVTQIMSHFN